MEPFFSARGYTVVLWEKTSDSPKLFHVSVVSVYIVSDNLRRSIQSMHEEHGNKVFYLSKKCIGLLKLKQ